MYVCTITRKLVIKKTRNLAAYCSLAVRHSEEFGVKRSYTSLESGLFFQFALNSDFSKSHCSVEVLNVQLRPVLCLSSVPVFHHGILMHR